MEIKSKIELKSKGEVANLPTVQQLLVTLKWTSTVDLDLMAFYTKKDGTDGGVYSDRISQDIKTMGDLNHFPFIKLSGDAGVNKTEVAEDSEELKITNLNEISTLNLIALNYDAAKDKDANATFSDFNGHITITNEGGEQFDVPLKSTEKGTVAHVATIDNSSAVGATLKMEDKVMNLSEFADTIPGASVLGK